MQRGGPIPNLATSNTVTPSTKPMAIVVNKPIPEFEANATGGLKVTNTSHNGAVLVLYFYPKDNTPGCTTEAMQFRDKYKDFVKAGAQVWAWYSNGIQQRG